MADHTSRFARRQGFLTLWALFFLVSVSLLMSVVVVGVTARREITRDLVQDYTATTKVIREQTRQHVKKSTTDEREKPLN